mmetsp:Transcript_32380/g.69806  ORF Transcript_32380/g.69806 Transcript_32380/m.69806 type:complete len:217 (+) Transcript_32380:528-1178(+)
MSTGHQIPTFCPSRPRLLSCFDGLFRCCCDCWCLPLPPLDPDPTLLLLLLVPLLFCSGRTPGLLFFFTGEGCPLLPLGTTTDLSRSLFLPSLSTACLRKALLLPLLRCGVLDFLLCRLPPTRAAADGEGHELVRVWWRTGTVGTMTPFGWLRWVGPSSETILALGWLGLAAVGYVTGAGGKASKGTLSGGMARCVGSVCRFSRCCPAALPLLPSKG